MIETQKPIPIDQMPEEFKDGRHVLLFGGVAGYCVETVHPKQKSEPCACYWSSSEEWNIEYDADGRYYLNPTHFLPVWQGVL